MNVRAVASLAFASLACASGILAQANQGRGQVPVEAGLPRRGQASDEANRGKVDQVKAGWEAGELESWGAGALKLAEL